MGTNDQSRRVKGTVGTGAVVTRAVQALRGFVGHQRERDAGLEGVSFAVLDQPTAATAYLYPPSLSLVLSGTKRVRLGTHVHTYDRSSFLLMAVHLPTVTEVLTASAKHPYVALRMRLDMPLIRDFITDADISAGPALHDAPLAIGETTDALLHAVGRLVDLLQQPQDLRHLGPLIQREIAYHVLTSAAGAQLRQMLVPDSGSQRAGRAVAWISQNFSHPLRIDDLAVRVGLGASTLHKHFRQMTSMTPLGYQKHLRLLEARRLLVMEHVEASTAAFRVGYESASQFSREYRRMFGQPPAQDAAALRARLRSEGTSS